jgi:PRTRC genetic system ThiF family protein
MKYVHHVAPYLIAPKHPLTICCIGAGGTGSQVVNNIARINHSLLALGHPGIMLTLFDDDKVSEANIGRQLFSRSDIGQYKASVLITRVNRFFGFGWKAECRRIDKFENNDGGNIIITCVDNVKSRKIIGNKFPSKRYKQAMVDRTWADYKTMFYWIDFGNTRDTAQVILGTLQNIQQIKSKDPEIQFLSFLPHVLDLYPNMESHEGADQGPSCSLAESLIRQDLFICSTIVQFGCNLIWKLLREHVIEYQGVFLNLKTLTVNPIKIKQYGKKERTKKKLQK